jgi:DNA polymerase III alpha subunit
MASYVPLWCKSNFSFLEGASHPDELIEEAQRLGLSCLGLTDRDGVYGIVRAHVKAQVLGFQLVIGSQVTIDPLFLLQMKRAFTHDEMLLKRVFDLPVIFFKNCLLLDSNP